MAVIEEKKKNISIRGDDKHTYRRTGCVCGGEAGLSVGQQSFTWAEGHDMVVTAAAHVGQHQDHLHLSVTSLIKS